MLIYTVVVGVIGVLGCISAYTFPFKGLDIFDEELDADQRSELILKFDQLSTAKASWKSVASVGDAPGRINPS